MLSLYFWFLGNALHKKHKLMFCRANPSKTIYTIDAPIIGLAIGIGPITALKKVLVSVKNAQNPTDNTRVSTRV